jgi:hypothetical protein
MRLTAARAMALAAVFGLAADGASARSPEEMTRVLVLSPKAAASADATHSALLVSRRSYSRYITFAGRVQTVRQLRTGSAPNPWECAWIVWHYQDQQHFYYLAIKPTGWEIGKRDPEYPGGQRFLASGSRRFPVATWHDFGISQNDGTMRVRMNGVHLASYTDSERPYTGGKLGVYAEDSEIEIDDITAPFDDDFEDYRLQTNKRDGVAMRNWIVPFLGFGHAAIADRKK